MTRGERWSSDREAGEMADVRKVGGLEIAEDLPFQMATWKLQRVAWGVMAAILVAALLGLFGGGVFGTATVGRPGGGRVEYFRFGRLQSPTTLDVYVTPEGGGEARVWVASDYADRAGIDRVEPVPARVEAGSDGLTYVLPIIPSDQPARVRFHLNPERPGLLRGRVRSGTGPTLRFTQFVHP